MMDSMLFDEEYSAFGIPLQEDVSDCDAADGREEVPLKKLFEKNAFLFAPLKQAHNQNCKGPHRRKIQMIDYETLTDKNHNRIIGFGRYAPGHCGRLQRFARLWAQSTMTFTV